MSEHLQEVVLDLGYIQPGHGVKGKQQWLVEDVDLDEMYTLFEKKQEIALWCFVRKSDSNNAASPTESTKNNRKRHNDSDITS